MGGRGGDVVEAGKILARLDGDRLRLQVAETDANLRKAYELTLPDPAPRPSARQPGQQYGTYNHHEATPGANTPWAPSTGRPPSAKERPFVWRSKNGTKYHAM
jgi:hypothetical protein